MGQGWICLHRKIRECDLIWDDKPFSRGQAWIDLLMQVNHEDKEIMFNARGVIVKRGQRITSIRNLGEQWGWSRTKVKLFLEELKKAGMIEFESDTKKTLVTVINYGVYQDIDTEKVPQKSHRKATEKPQKDTNNNDNNVNNDNNNTPLPPKGGTDNPLYDFDKHSNLENLKHVLNEKMFPEWEYIKAHPELYQNIKDWMEYKDARKPRSSNHYANGNSISQLLKKFVDNSKKYGVDAVINVVNDSISQAYQGIVWEKIKKTDTTTGVASIKI